ncbi:hypothetical protein DFR65_101719 [Oceanihabitans sediminis]|uniref:Outer membrane protein beta-barrel domain-containing protein n=1 Tax=Oceanihabitans sediminis TaxID=1812012 RepID=A0A368P8N9_9FLAO|nr:DUF6646 family protein [Oceanihabitans sediminis]RBP34819.1 hypothetical protein DFR65_101719 [Oceanihabitans sediminis]RCU58464.1 hypothetical protein DU428_03560 [Oceanihabitans sediminis]
MKNILAAIALFSVSFMHAQSFSGSGDQKVQIGANFQNNATGINVSYDYGLGENMSIGFTSSYALGIPSELKEDRYVAGVKVQDKASFTDRFDLKARFNANIGNVLNIDENFDLYPGLNLGLKNFGSHLGARYFFSNGFGIYSELNLPIAKYNTDKLTAAEKIHNQFTVNAGVVFNL